MHPQLFLKTFWQIEFRPQIFVAMSFEPRYKSRFDEVIAPAIRSITVGGVKLEPYRVDMSKSGDSILTDIIDGIAHSQMVLADVSSTRIGFLRRKTYRNGNVMYEVGLALACRHSSEVLLIRDDHDKFLFDVSTIPHMTIDFSKKNSAITILRDALISRLNERKHINDARVQLAIAGLTNEEAEALKYLADLPPGSVYGRKRDGRVDFFGMASIPRLLDKQLIKLIGEFQEGHPAYHPTPLGRVVAQLVKSGLRQFKADAPKSEEEHKKETTNE